MRTNHTMRRVLTAGASALLIAGTPLALQAEDTQKSDFSFDLYGFVQADTIYDFKRVDPNWNDTLRVTTIPTSGEPFGGDGEFVFGVRQSRIGMKAGYPTEQGDITALLEFEFFGVGGDAGQTTPRLRHAWVTWNNIGAGQTWSNFMDADVFPNQIDYWGPTGMVFYRNQQLRYSFPMVEDEFSISIEDPGTALDVGKFRDTSSCDLPNSPGSNCGSTVADIFKAKNNLPDFTVRYRDNTDWGHWQLAGIVRKLGYERLDNGNSSSETGYGFNASTVINTVGNDQLKLQVAYGPGIGNYFNDGGVDLAPDSDNLLEADATAVKILGLVAYYDRWWNDKWSSTIGWSMTSLDREDGQAGDEFRRGMYANVNLLFHPTDHLMTGIEFLWGQREDIDGTKGQDYRIQFSLKVDFSLSNIL